MSSGGKIKYSDSFVASLAQQYRDGATYGDIAKCHGISKNTVNMLLRRARNNGVSTDRQGGSYFLTNRKHARVAFGTFRVMMRELPSDVGHWLERETPDGATICDIVAGIIKDAYSEDTGK